MSSSGGHDLSHIKYEGSHDHADDHVAILVSKWNEKVTGALLSGAKATLLAANIPESQIRICHVPGSYELPSAANMLLEHESLDGIICLGCVIQGETRHFDFICQAVAQGITNVSLNHNRPVIFGVLTPDTQQQAEDRAGGKYGNKGEEAAVALLEMIDLQKNL